MHLSAYVTPSINYPRGPNPRPAHALACTEKRRGPLPGPEGDPSLCLKGASDLNATLRVQNLAQIVKVRVYTLLTPVSPGPPWG